jgi:hypothetical protein
MLNELADQEVQHQRRANAIFIVIAVAAIVIIASLVLTV